MDKLIKIAVCDDEILFLEQIRKRLKKAMEHYKYNCQIETFSSALALQPVIVQGQSFDIYFLDIDMPKLDGISLGKTIRQRESDTYIIFVSSKEGMVFETFGVRPFQFIRKGNLDKDFQTVMGALDRELKQEQKEKDFVLETGTVSYRFHVRKTVYIEAEGKYLNIYQTDDTFYVRYQISALEEQLKEHNFLRIHKSYLVNPRYIYLLEPGWAVLEGGKRLPVSRHRYKEVQQEFLDYMHRQASF